MSAAADFLGVGWAFPVHRDGSGDIALARYDESIQQAIWIILGTARGDRPMRPGFGCGIHDLVFGANDAATVGRLRDDVHEALVRWEPRIDVVAVQVGPRPDEPSTLLVAIQYRVRATNNLFNLVYPFYLERAPA